MALQPQRPVCFCRGTVSKNSHLRTRSVLGLFPQSSLRFQEVTRITATPRMLASSGYSKKQPRRLIPQTEASTPRGFAPRPQAGTSTRKKDQNKVDEKEEASASSSSGKRTISSSGGSTDRRRVAGEAQTAEADRSSRIPSTVGNRGVGVTEQKAVAGGDGTDGRTAETGNEGGDGVGLRSQRVDHGDGETGREAQNGMAYTSGGIQESRVERKAADMVAAGAHNKQLLESLADQNISRGNKVFVVPEIVRPDGVIRVFLNRSSSALADEAADVLIRGAYNGWRWKSFTEKLQKAEDVKGDWWCCQIYVPKEAYRVDYVFFNGATTYENNNSNDFFLPVEGGMDEAAFEDFLLEEEHKRLEKHPLVGIITRLTVQKGIHLIKHAVWRTLELNGQVVLLGSAPDPRIQSEFANLATQLHSSHGDRVRFCLTYDEPLSHLIYAGADLVLVPSIFEPCGLTQLIAMRYGSVPVVRRTGGLYDTVFDVDDDKERARAGGLEPNGFSFDGADSAALDYALDRAMCCWFERREWFDSLCKRVMQQDWSWNRPALDYMELYHSARNKTDIVMMMIWYDMI